MIGAWSARGGHPVHLAPEPHVYRLEIYARGLA